MSCFDAVQIRHRYVSHNDVRFQTHGCVDQLESVASYSHYLECWLQELRHTLQQQGMIVGKEDTWTIPSACRFYNL